MAEFLETIENIRAQEASVQRLFAGEGQGVRSLQKTQQYMAKLAEAAKFVADVFDGKRPAYHLQEAMTTSDFPLLFGDILDRQLLANYRETPVVYRNYCKIATVRDFRTVSRHHVDGGESVLDEVKQKDEYPETSLSEGRYQYSVSKYGRRIPFSWESMINDDLDALRDVPARFGRAARRTEQKKATQLYCDANGPHASFYKSANKNIVTGNPVLSIPGLQTALEILADQVDEDGEPIYIEMVHLVIPPALEITANNILNALQLELNESGGTANQKLIVANWMKNRLKLHVDPYIPIVASSANGKTSWFLFANPGSGRPALEVGFLRGHTEPEIFIKSPNAQRVGGGNVDPMAGDFDTDSIQYKVRHCLGGSQMDPKMSVASNGSGA
ncbi:MAG: hypothetical protein FH756_01560 [Firmicutes bacterium]|nr:hypothetical protein [Bacillota bacterium]